MDFDALWNFADPAGTERQFRAALPALVSVVYSYFVWRNDPEGGARVTAA